MLIEPPTIRISTEADPSLVDSIRAIHKASLPGDITSNLTSAYYARVVSLMADARNGFLAVAYEAGRPIGFCSVVLDPNAFNAKIGSNRIDLVKSLALFAISRPQLLLDLAGAVFGNETLTESIDGAPEIFVMCVDPSTRSKGVEHSLLACCIEALRNRGEKALMAKTGNPRALAFYKREGFREIGEQNRFRRTLSVLKRDL